LTASVASRLGGDVDIVTFTALAERPMMHQFLPDVCMRRSGSVAAAVRVSSQLWKETPSSIVPYIVMLPDPAVDGPDPPCAHALHRTTAVSTANRIFMTALFTERKRAF